MELHHLTEKSDELILGPLLRLSLMEDILVVSRFDDNGNPLSQNSVKEAQWKMLSEPTLVDARGRIVIPFSTELTEVSPLTRNHKIKFIEVEMNGAGVGDSVARLYLRQKGTGTVHALGGEKLFFTSDGQSAVINPIVNESKRHDPAVYRNDRLQDRPLLNSRWELIINLEDEAVNEDIDLRDLTDIVLYIYYSDFTEN